MRAMVVDRLEGLAALAAGELPAPVPGGDEVLIDVHRAGVAFPDLLMTRGLYQRRPELPFAPGMEAAGVVVSAPDGSGVAAGDRVAALCWHGGYAEQVACPAVNVFPMPPGMSFDVAAAVTLNYLTAVFALEHRGALRAGETVLVHGASGGLGTACVQVAAADGARVIAVVADADRRGGPAREAGAHDVVDAEGFKDAARELSGGRGVDVVVDPVGGDRFTDSLRSLAPEGRVLVLGFTAGDIPQVKVNRLLLGNLGVLGVATGEYAAHHPEAPADWWRRVAELFTAGLVNPPLAQVLPLERAADALRLVEQRRVAGKVVLAVRD